MIQKLAGDKTCKGCVYYRSLRNGSSDLTRIKACHYCYDTGEPRGSPIEKCTKKKLGPKKPFGKM